jgi:hypothetical protein
MEVSSQKTSKPYTPKYECFTKENYPSAVGEATSLEIKEFGGNQDGSMKGSSATSFNQAYYHLNGIQNPTFAGFTCVGAVRPNTAKHPLSLEQPFLGRQPSLRQLARRNLHLHQGHGPQSRPDRQPHLRRTLPLQGSFRRGHRYIHYLYHHRHRAV